MPTQPDLKTTLDERGSSYGPFYKQAHLSQKLKGICHGALSHNAKFMQLTDEEQDTIREGLDMIQHKIARLLNGDPTHEDSWVDIQGYASITIRDIKYMNG